MTDWREIDVSDLCQDYGESKESYATRLRETFDRLGRGNVALALLREVHANGCVRVGRGAVIEALVDGARR